jgi:hypothetical protein
LRCLCTFFNCGIVHRVTIGWRAVPPQSVPV